MSTAASTTTTTTAAAPANNDPAGYTPLSQPKSADLPYLTQGTPSVNALVASTATSKSRLDDAIYFSKRPAIPLVTNDDPYQFNHWLQFSTGLVPAAGTTYQSWVGYNGWDTQTASTVKILTSSSVSTFQAGANSINTGVNLFCNIDFSTATTLPTDNSKNQCATGTNTVSFPSVTTWSAAVAADTTKNVAAKSATLVTRLSQTFLGDPVIKVGDTISYKAGFRWVQATGATPITGTSSQVNWTVVDGASALVMTGVAAALATIAF